MATMVFFMLTISFGRKKIFIIQLAPDIGRYLGVVTTAGLLFCGYVRCLGVSRVDDAGKIHSGTFHA